ncbi:hypothetical protein [Planotetraspora mira]|uniref:Uncharacterized protein n=1 Tax=Planotetraspora mira TaxID=58121 RepID=A0A8J3TPF7_9ACTN|nr:hypothetical protein [Planotetraspora mira]GII28962.1 hypothetical protein Pmi06nite_24040 [Planotetraspora mira]
MKGLSPGGEAPDPRLGATLRFATELVAWVATPWALWSHSVVLALVSVLVLIGLPTLFSTPGDKASVIVPVPGWVVILLVLLQFAAAAVASWFAWPPVVAVLVWILVVAAAVTQGPRWRWLALNPGAPRS